MRTLLPFAAMLLAAAAPAATENYAVVDQPLAAGARSEAGRAVIARAKAALGRPPGAIAHLHTEGTLPGHGIREISLKAKEDQPIILDLALAWTLTREAAYRDAADRYLAAWADTYQISLNPIDETGFDALILADDLIHSELPPATQGKLDRLWRSFASGYLDAMVRPRKAAINNWQSHRVKLATMAAFRTGDPQLIARAHDAFRAQLAANLRPDGSTIDYEERDALHYVTYDLDPLLMASLAARAHGANWYSEATPEGASLSRSLDWLAPFARGDKVQIEFARSGVPFDRQRAAAGQDEYAPHPWDTANAVSTYSLAVALDPRFRPLLTSIVRRTGRRPASWLLLTGKVAL
jgi:hypothetical protein